MEYKSVSKQPQQEDRVLGRVLAKEQVEQVAGGIMTNPAVDYTNPFGDTTIPVSDTPTFPGESTPTLPFQDDPHIPQY
jgi:hypothetical protein